MKTFGGALLPPAGMRGSASLPAEATPFQGVRSKIEDEDDEDSCDCGLVMLF